jgi:hypothetical protein
MGQSLRSLRVASADLDGNGEADTLVTAPGPGTVGPLIRRFDALSFELIDEFFAFSPSGGAFVAG